MIKLNLPEFEPKIKQKDDNTYIFDPIRKKYLVLTPEEWVRQHVIAFLVHHKKYPQGLLAIEKSITFNNMTRRPDVSVFDKNAQALLIVECKAAHVNISQQVFDQIVRYNSVLHAKYLMVTNGLKHYVCQINFSNNSYQFIQEIPFFDQIK